jgi:hypothetical protein
MNRSKPKPKSKFNNIQFSSNKSNLKEIGPVEWALLEVNTRINITNLMVEFVSLNTHIIGYPFKFAVRNKHKYVQTLTQL